MLLAKRLLLAAAVAAVVGQAPAAVRAADLGTIEGQIVIDGAIPVVKPRVQKGDKTVRDAETCAVEDIPNEGLQVDPTTKGVANVVIYLRNAPANMPAELKESSVKELLFDQKQCRFLPHVMAVRTDQTVMCVSDDEVAHNVNVTPFVNPGVNFIVPAKSRTGTPVKLPKKDFLPVKVKCDIHPWMDALWVVTDHPYVGITDEKGNFKIEGLPVGEHSFTIWHESAGYINRKYTVKVKAGAQTLPAEKVAASKFKLN